MMQERRSMCLKDWLQLAAWGVAALVFYFNSSGDVAGKIAALDSRMAVSESRIQQETRGYENLLSSFNARIDKLEVKIDRLAERVR